ncbi:RagB/SusD family nutrient uptake outer membrane protein [Bacteroides fragilis]|nr:RagB/SusD family nutrient uptake outer membrane protein [Bacteroides fragilis]
MVTLDPYDTWTAEEDYPVIRYAEVLLTYAEARIQNSWGWDTEVQKALNDRRDRCGMLDVPPPCLQKKKLCAGSYTTVTSRPGQTPKYKLPWTR